MSIAASISIVRKDQFVAVHLIDADEVTVFPHGADVQSSQHAHGLVHDGLDAVTGGFDADPFGDFRHAAITTQRLVFHDEKFGDFTGGHFERKHEPADGNFLLIECLDADGDLVVGLVGGGKLIGEGSVVHFEIIRSEFIETERRIVSSARNARGS